MIAALVDSPAWMITVYIASMIEYANVLIEILYRDRVASAHEYMTAALQQGVHRHHEEPPANAPMRVMSTMALSSLVTAVITMTLTPIITPRPRTLTALLRVTNPRRQSLHRARTPTGNHTLQIGSARQAVAQVRRRPVA